jgi:hypothetical protein
MTATMKFTSIAAALLVSIVCVTFVPKNTIGGVTTPTNASVTVLDSRDTFDFIAP